MSKTMIRKLPLTNRLTILGSTMGLLAVVVLIMSQDYLRANLNDTGYYFSESLMFSSFWWLFAPLLFAQYAAFKDAKAKGWVVQLSLILFLQLTHLLGFPFIVLSISEIFYYHTFSFQQTLRYTVSEHLYQLILIYPTFFLCFHFYQRPTNTSERIIAPERNLAHQLIKTIVVSEGNKKCLVAVDEILYFSANAPYINIHLADKRYLQNESLKSISAKLNPEQFVRIHKSAIINIEMAASYVSRLNGDYDLTMKNGMILRVSRNFAIDFKRQFQATHHLTQK